MPIPADRPGRVLLVFLDGVGIGPDNPEVNPFAAAPVGGYADRYGAPTSVELPASVPSNTPPVEISAGAAAAPVTPEVKKP